MRILFALLLVIVSPLAQADPSREVTVEIPATILQRVDAGGKVLMSTSIEIRLDEDGLISAIRDVTKDALPGSARDLAIRRSGAKLYLVLNSTVVSAIEYSSDSYAYWPLGSNATEDRTAVPQRTRVFSTGDKILEDDTITIERTGPATVQERKKQDSSNGRSRYLNRLDGDVVYSSMAEDLDRRFVFTDIGDGEYVRYSEYVDVDTWHYLGSPILVRGSLRQESQIVNLVNYRIVRVCNEVLASVFFRQLVP